MEPCDDHGERALREYLWCLELDIFDIDSQLRAIGAVLRQHEKAKKAFDEEIDQFVLDAGGGTLFSGGPEYGAGDAWVDYVDRSAYLDAAYSMAAIGMLAPLIETLFYRIFQGIGKRFFKSRHPDVPHSRWDNSYSHWDCRYVYTGGGRRKDVAKGIGQMIEALGLSTKFPLSTKQTFSALFSYRNHMFHQGFEWPLGEREKFRKQILNEKWPKDWFTIATDGDQPWIFYLSEQYIWHCFEVIDQALDAICIFIRDEIKREALTAELENS